MAEGNRLMLCAGDVRREGWMTLDADPVKGGNFIATIPPLPPEVKAIEWQEIEWVHGISMLYPWEAKDFLPEIHSAILPGGKLTLEQPDYDKCKDSVAAVFGDSVQFRSPLMVNRWGYTPASLTALVVASGFREIQILPARYHVPARDFRLEAIA